MAELENRFYKVQEDGGTFVTGIFYNPITGEEKHEVLRDYDYIDKSRDNDDLYYMEIDRDVEKIWRHKNGEILDGDTVFICKGRKIPIGSVKVVDRKKPIYDRYRRWVADYLVFTDGTSTNVNNCIMVVNTSA